jgi:hypothetical protein
VSAILFEAAPSRASANPEALTRTDDVKNSNGKIVKLLYASVALFVLAALVLQVLASAGRLPASVPESFPTFVSAAALIVALVVLVVGLLTGREPV